MSSLFSVGERHEERPVAVVHVPGLVGLYREEHGRQQVVAVCRGLRRHRDEERVGERGLGDDLQVDVAGRDRIARDEALAELPTDGAGVVVGEGFFGDVEACGVDVVFHVLALEVHLDRRVADLVDHLEREPVVDLGVRHRLREERHGPGRGDLRERDDGEEELLPLHPPRLHLAPHVPAHRAVDGPIDPVVFLLLHGEVGLQDLLHRVLLGALRQRVVGLVLRVLLYKGRLPGELLDLLVSLGNASARHAMHLLSASLPLRNVVLFPRAPFPSTRAFPYEVPL